MRDPSRLFNKPITSPRYLPVRIIGLTVIVLGSNHEANAEGVPALGPLKRSLPQESWTAEAFNATPCFPIGRGFVGLPPSACPFISN